MAGSGSTWGHLPEGSGRASEGEVGSVRGVQGPSVQTHTTHSTPWSGESWDHRERGSAARPGATRAHQEDGIQALVSVGALGQCSAGGMNWSRHLGNSRCCPLPLNAHIPYCPESLGLETHPNKCLPRQASVHSCGSIVKKRVTSNTYPNREVFLKAEKESR